MKKLLFIYCIGFSFSLWGQSDFKVPSPTIINNPDFYIKNTQGMSDGKTIGMDGQKLTDHKIYIYDTNYFLERMDLSLKTKDPKRQALYSDLKRLAKTDGDSRAEEVKAFHSKYKKDPNKMPQFIFFELKYKIEQARNKYSAASSQLNYKEKLRVKDRVDLENAPNEEGKKLRENMKEAITEIVKLRAQVDAKFASVLKRGEALQLKEHTKPNFPTFIVNQEKTLFLAYRELKGSSLLGMEEFINGKALSKARAMELSKGAVVYLQKIEEFEINGKKTKIYYVMSEGGVKEVSSNYVVKQKMFGWVYPGHFEKK